MMRYVSLCLVLLTVACGPANDSSSDLQSRSSSKTHAASDSWTTPAADNSSDQIDPSSPNAISLDYPLDADPKLTPGLRCAHADETRYPEKIAYCERNVSKSRKDRVIRSYDSLGYHLEEMDRSKIKIDHYIPLCMGGDNADSNLWPQYEAVYSKTDMLEEQICLALSRGLITQDESIDQMLYAKAHLSEAATILAKIKALL